MCKFPSFHWEIWGLVFFSLYISLSSWMQLSECSWPDKTCSVIAYLKTKWKMNCHYDVWILVVGLQTLSLVKSPLHSLCLRKKTVLGSKKPLDPLQASHGQCLQFTSLTQTLLRGITTFRKWPLLSFKGQSRTTGWETQGHAIVDAANMEQERELPDSDPNFNY